MFTDAQRCAVLIKHAEEKRICKEARYEERCCDSNSAPHLVQALCQYVVVQSVQHFLESTFFTGAWLDLKLSLGLADSWPVCLPC